MFKRVFFSILLATMFLVQCRSEPDQEKTVQDDSKEVTNEVEKEGEEVAADTTEKDLPKQPAEKKPNKPVYPRLNDENAEEFLREYGKEHRQTRVLIKTNYGDITVKLYEDTPLHRANFLYLIERGYYDPVEITRIIDDFMIQGGNSQDSKPSDMRYLIGKYTIPSEFRLHHIHKKGALAMSRNYEDNPEKRSSAYNFYIVDGRKIGDMGLFNAEQQRGEKYTERQEKIYRNVGGAAHLDYEHTVFGEVIDGMDVVEEISELKTDKADWPIKHVEVRMKVLD
jgi:cyclophilin family peptidyl-prolyl cis-trans isomerase